MEIYLALQEISDGRVQLRRFALDGATVPGGCFEPYTMASIEWLYKNGMPEFKDGRIVRQWFVDTLDPFFETPYQIVKC